MKKILYCCTACLFSFIASAQDTTAVAAEKAVEKTVSAVPQIRFYGFYPIHFGDQQFADAYHANPGFGFSISPIRYKDLRLLLGFERSTYKVDNHTLVAQPVDQSSYQSLFAAVSYSIGSETSFCVKPTLGAGVSMLYLKTGSERFGNQPASDLRAGLTADWAVYKHLSVFLTANYVHSNIDVDTAEELHDFYSKANSVQVGFGLMIR